MNKLIIVLFLWISTSASAQTSGSGYVDKYKDAAVRLMNAHGIPASVVLAVAMHESANGNSKIARYLNNHFGMKGKNSSTKIQSAYRGYESVDLSYENFVSMLQNRRQFAPLFEKYSSHDYKNWVLGIQRGGYAASRTWGSQVLATIKQYRLYEYDRPETQTAAAQPLISTAQYPLVETAFTSLYKVRSGDTLVKIAQKLGISVKTLMRKNSLTSSNLSVGQQLKI